MGDEYILKKEYDKLEKEVGRLNKELLVQKEAFEAAMRSRDRVIESQPTLITNPKQE